MRACSIALGFLALSFVGQSSLAQPLGDRPDIWDMELGGDVSQIPRLLFQDYACGTNGGPAARPLFSFADFDRCEPEGSGLHEVQFRYDDEQEFIARAFEAEGWIERLEGTRPFGAPSIISALIDDNGILQGLRIVTDDRVTDEQRSAAYTYRFQYKNRYGLDGWQCTEMPPDEDRTPVGDRFVDERCTKQLEGLNLSVEASYYRRPGQATIDPVTRRVTEGQFISKARLEVYQAPFWPSEN